LAWAGVRLDEAANARHERLIHHPASAVRIVVIEANEELPIAQAIKQLQG
jgi:acetate kinase